MPVCKLFSPPVNNLDNGSLEKEQTFFFFFNQTGIFAVDLRVSENYKLSFSYRLNTHICH